MRRFQTYFSLSVLVFLGACTPLGIYYKPNIAVATVERDKLNCKVEAANKVPVDNEIEIIPGAISPPREVCNSTGQCHVIPGRRAPNRVIVIDANEGLRRQVVGQCMRDLGYEYVKVPHCDAKVKIAVPRQTSVLPRLSGTSCVVRGKRGAWQIVDPG